MSRNVLTWKIFFLIVITDVVESAAALSMKTGLTNCGITAIQVYMNNMPALFLRAIASYMIWVGALLYIVNFLIWIIILSRIQLSVAFPLGSTCYIFVPVLAMILLHEHVGILRWAGIFLIIIGINFVAKSSQRSIHD